MDAERRSRSQIVLVLVLVVLEFCVDYEDEKFCRSLRTIWTIAVQRLSAVGLSLRPSRLCGWQTLVLWLRLRQALQRCAKSAS